MYTVIMIGGLWFWLLVVSEMIYLAYSMGLERTKGAQATASLVVFLTILACFSDLKGWALSHLGWSLLGYGLGLGLSYVAIGLLWSFLWMWPRWGAKRKQIHKRKLSEWLETQGIRGGECPDSMKEELSLVVFGNLDQEPIERQLKELQFAYRRTKGMTTHDNTITAGNFQDFLALVTTTDPEMIEDLTLRRDVSHFRKDWLKTQKIHHTELGIVIPDRLMADFRKRVTTPYTRRSGDTAWADVATEPLFRSNKAKLATWAAYWPFSMLWYGAHEFCYDLWLWTVGRFEGIGQRLMHAQYKDVRSDFEVSKPVKNDFTSPVAPDPDFEVVSKN